MLPLRQLDGSSPPNETFFDGQMLSSISRSLTGSDYRKCLPPETFPSQTLPAKCTLGALESLGKNGEISDFVGK